MRHREEAKLRKTPTAGHGAAGHFEHVRYDGGGRNAVLLKYDAVEDTPRAA
jgi:hypothetical protein